MKFAAMRACIKTLCFLCALCGPLFCVGLDREVFSIQHYDLNLQIDPAQHRLGARGKITLRNDSSTPQKIAVLQISSSLDWRAIRVGDKPVQFVMQPYTSDIDHTGALSEAIVTLPQQVASHATVELDIAYEGVIVLDATRLTRIGTPDDAAQSSDWDQIDPKFTGLRGAGNVAWYPIATEVANLSEGDSLFEVLGRWKAREAGSQLKVVFQQPEFPSDSSLPTMLCSGRASAGASRDDRAIPPWAECTYDDLDRSTPSFVIANYGVVKRPSIAVYNLAFHATAAEAYADAAEKIAPFIAGWFGPPREPARTADLPDPDAAPFESGALLLTPLGSLDPKITGLAAAHQLTHASFSSPRTWIEEGLAHFAQALYLEQQKGRQAALGYMGLHRAALAAIETPAALPPSQDDVNHSLINTASAELNRGKAMCVWWMLRDMLGDAALKKAIAAYKPEQDKDPSYMPHLIAAQTQRDLEWFFDDWVYRDRGLPDFKIESVFPSKTTAGNYIVTITVDNLGTAGAEVPVITRSSGSDIAQRIEVRAKSKATIRVETSSRPLEVVVNDGSVPESDTTNNVFKVEPAKD